MVKKGDTLIEVILAIGIFSLVAVSIVAVMSSGTSGAQTALETTLTREEIDAEAEALRFIQSSYIAARSAVDATDVANSNNPYALLWQEIAKNAVEANNSNVSFSPDSCAELYEGGKENNAFVINYRAIKNYIAQEKPQDFVNTVYYAKKDSEDKFSTSSTYPRLVFSADKDADEYNTNTENLSSNDFYTNLYKAEGIYVIAVKEGEDSGVSSAYYDFYIRSCWYGTGDSVPSTISTVIRLSDPEKIVKNKKSDS